MTKDEFTDTIKRFKKNFRLYALNCLNIRDKAGKIKTLELNKAQLYAHKRIEDQLESTSKVRALILKGRQQGMSTYVEGRFYWRTTLSVGKQAFILTHLQDSTDALFDMTKRYHDLCPELYRPATQAASAKELAFSDLDSGYIVATAGSKAAGRGRSIQYLHGSEVAFWVNAEDHMAGMGQAVPDLPGTEVILESTANGVGNLFHKMWQDAERGRGDYIAIFVPWFWQDEYRRPLPSDFAISQDEQAYKDLHDLDDEQIYWRRIKIVDDFRDDVALFSQEYPATPGEAFRRVSGEPFINPDLVTKARQNTQDVQPSGAVIIGVDPAEYGNDDTAIVVRQGRKASEIKRYSKRGTMEVVGLVSILADRIKPDAINVDCTGVGSGVADRLLELGYPVNRVHFGAKALDTDRYAIRRDEMWGEMREWFEDTPCQIPDDDSLDGDLCSPQYTYDSSRRVKLESKESMKKRGVHSPDSADALALTFAVRIASAVKIQAYRGKDGIRAGRQRDWRS